jgi:hypothetical protein
MAYNPDQLRTHPPKSNIIGTGGAQPSHLPSSGTKEARGKPWIIQADQGEQLGPSVPRWDQAALESSSSVLTLSHAGTTDYSESVFGADDHLQDLQGSDTNNTTNGPDQGEKRKKQKKRMTESVYSFNSDNAAQFVKNIHGR